MFGNVQSMRQGVPKCSLFKTSIADVIVGDGALAPFGCESSSSCSIVVRTWKGLFVKLLSGLVRFGVHPVSEGSLEDCRQMGMFLCRFFSCTECFFSFLMVSIFLSNA